MRSRSERSDRGEHERDEIAPGPVDAELGFGELPDASCELLPAARESLVRRARVEPEQTRDIGERSLLKLEQNKRFAIHGRASREGSRDHSFRLHVAELIERRRWVRDLARLYGRRRKWRMTRILASSPLECVASAIARDPTQPRGQPRRVA